MSGSSSNPPPPPLPSVNPPVNPAATGANGAPKLGGRRKTAWMTHVKATMRANKGLKLKQVLKLAKKTYKKSMKGGASDITPFPLNGAGRRRGTRRSRRGGNETGMY